MKIITIAGLPCAGKTLLIAHLIGCFMSSGFKAAAVRLDCSFAGDGNVFNKGFTNESGQRSCHFICPGFSCLSTLKEVFKWGKLGKLDVLFIEMVVFCCSWIPRISNVPVIMVMDNLRGIYSQGKMRCLLSFADTLVITKTDLVCRAETEMFQSKIRQVHPNAPIVTFNGLNGKGTLTLKRIIGDFKETDEISEKNLCCPGFEFPCNEMDVIEKRRKEIKYGQKR